ncbi:MAG: putative ABC transporter permease, partial [Erysipelotrichaceae bacterium]|nr:putative ABC transporter permease [Erysipelotrichaceae bacterium]
MMTDLKDDDLMNKVIVIFFMFAFLGWVWESIYCTAKDRKWANRGFLYGPICPIYGCGGIIGLFACNLVKESILPDLSPWQMFGAGFVVSMILEYPTSWILEKLFQA